MHLCHLTTSLNIRYLDQLRFSVDVKFSDARFFFLPLRRDPEAQGRCVLSSVTLHHASLRFLLLWLVVLVLLLDDQIGHAKLCSLDLLDLHENVRDALLYDLFFISRIIFVEHESDLLDLR